MFNTIKFRVLLIFLVLGVFPLAGFMIWEYNKSVDRLRQRSFEQLKTVRETKKHELEWYFMKLRDETKFFAQSSVVINAMKDFKSSFNDLTTVAIPSDYPNKLKVYYTEQFKQGLGPFETEVDVKQLVPDEANRILLQNQYLIGSRTPFKDLPYFKVHSQYHIAISSFINAYNIYDLFLVDDETGNIIYSVSKEIDFATSLLSGPFANSNIGVLFRKIRYTGLKNETMMSDFERYLPSRLAPAAFIAAPIFEGEIKIGTLILQVPLKKIDEITTGRKAWRDEGLGETGETYIVGSDYKMRTDSRFMIESSKEYIQMISATGTATKNEISQMDHYKTTVLFQKVNSETVTKALAKTSGILTIVDYRKRNVLSSYAPLEIKDMSWALLAEIDADEIFESSRQGARQSVALLFIITVVMFIASVLLARTIYRPIRKLAAGTKMLGQGNFDIQIDIKSRDELGFLAETFNTTIRALKEQRDEIVAKNTLLDEQKSELATQAENLMELNDSIVEINRNLDEKVKARTLKLQQQNEKLIEYAHFNSHGLRSPVATILGLMTVIKMSDDENDKTHSLALLEKATHDLDKVVHHAQNLLDSAEFKEE